MTEAVRRLVDYGWLVYQAGAGDRTVLLRGPHDREEQVVLLDPPAREGRAAVSAPTARWALSPDDDLAHAVTDPAEEGKLTAWCGHTMPPTAGLDEVPRAQLCPACAVAVAPDFADRAALTNAARDAEGLDPLVEP